jgi:protein-S-isoprenylcysteine O-methyltransferase Ste14
MGYVIVQIALFAFFAAAFFAGGRPLLPDVVRVAAPLLLAVAAALVLAAVTIIGRHLRIQPAPGPDAPLVTHGVYRRFRHPMYTAVVVAVVGLFLMRSTVAVGLVAAALVGFLHLKARHEESLLAARHPGYREYRARSWGVIPGWPSRSR